MPFWVLVALLVWVAALLLAANRSPRPVSIIRFIVPMSAFILGCRLACRFRRFCWLLPVFTLSACCTHTLPAPGALTASLDEAAPLVCGAFCARAGTAVITTIIAATAPTERMNIMRRKDDTSFYSSQSPPWRSLLAPREPQERPDAR